MSEQHQAVEDIIKVKTPGKYNVIFLNDNFTPIEYVIQLLVGIFNKDLEDAKRITLEIHEKGRGIAGTYSYEVAEQKCVETITDARKNRFPLDVVMDEA